MKKKLKKVTALALAAATITSMSTVAFAAQGDVDNDGLNSANDAAVVYFYASATEEEIAAKFSEKTLKSIEANGGVFLKSLITGSIEAGDASRILDLVNNGGDFSAMVKQELEDIISGKVASPKITYTDADGKEVTVDLVVVTAGDDGTTITLNGVQERDPETGTFKRDASGKVVAKTSASVKAENLDTTNAAAVVEAAFEEIAKVVGFDEETPEEYKFVFSYGDIKFNFDVTSSESVLPALDEALTNQKATVIDKATGLLNALTKFTVNGVSAGTEEGWKKIGSKIAADQNAFLALRPEGVDDKYVEDFVVNYMLAFPEENKETALANLEGLTVGAGTEGVTLTIDGETDTDPKSAAKKLVENFLYADGTPASYDFEKLTLSFGASNTLEVTKTKVE